MEKRYDTAHAGSFVNGVCHRFGSGASAGTCESKAIGKDGRELAGAARTSFLAKCKREACAPKAVGSDGKPLRGAAKNSFMAKCVREQG